MLVGVGVDRNGSQAHGSHRVNHAARDFAAVGDEDAVDRFSHVSHPEDAVVDRFEGA